MTVGSWMRAGVSALLVWASAVSASGAQALQPPARVTGPIALVLDARETPRRIFHVRETIPVAPGPLTLVYPKWLPGEHEPAGPITDVVGLHVSANGQPLPWRRNPLDVYAFHVTVPDGARSIEVAFDFLSALSTSGFTSAASVTAHLGVYSWNQVVLYPLGSTSDDVRVAASLQLPDGWAFATALTVDRHQANTVTFAPVSLTTLVDSPVIAGEHLQTVSLDTSVRPVSVSMVSDRRESVEAPAAVVEAWTRLVREADALFGARHFDRYRFLITLSDRVAHFGLEHHQSNDSRLSEDAVIRQRPALETMAHEYVHSWNGKYRRPAGLATSDFQQPMAGDLLWVYEGLTQHLGYVLAVRSGLIDESRYRERLAAAAAVQDHRYGRAWRSLGDTSVSAQLLYGAPTAWAMYRRSVDFYDEGALVWLEVDTRIRALTGGQKSLDDFCRLFHGGTSGPAVVRPYSLDDIVTTLTAVAPSDWRTFFEARVDRPSPRAPLQGIVDAGWTLTYTDVRNDVADELADYLLDASYSIGLRVAPNDGAVRDVVPGSPAATAGIAPGMQILSVNGRRYSAEVLRDAIARSKDTSSPLPIEVQNDDVVTTVSVDYHGGAREPHLTRVAGTADVLARILAPRAR